MIKKLHAVGLAFIVYVSVYATTFVLYESSLIVNHEKEYPQKRHQTTHQTPVTYTYTPFPITAVILSHKRPTSLLRENVFPSLISHPSITAVVVGYSDEAKWIEMQEGWPIESIQQNDFGGTDLDSGLISFEVALPGTNIHNVNAAELNLKLGLSLRYFLGSLANTDYLLTIDDDMIVTTESIDSLLGEYAKNPQRIVGNYGRTLNWFGLYSTQNRYGNVPVVLTKFCIFPRSLCGLFFERQKVIFELLDNKSHGFFVDGRWLNGEDIFASLIANEVFGTPEMPAVNFAVEIKLGETYLAGDEYEPISGGGNPWKMWTHKWDRGRIWQTLESIMKIND